MAAAQRAQGRDGAHVGHRLCRPRRRRRGARSLPRTASCARSSASTSSWRALERRLVRAPNETYFAYVFAGAAPAGLEPVLDADEVEAIEWCDVQAYRRWVAEGRRLSPVGQALAESFWELG